MYQRADLKEGMTVRSIDGHKLGKVYAVGETEFHIEKGLFFPRDYSVLYAEISDIRTGEVILVHGRESLRPFSDEVPYGSGTIGQREGIGTTPVTRGETSDAEWLNAGERTGVPLGSDLRTRDLGEQETGPYNTEGARASPFLTEEDRERGMSDIGTRPLASEDGGVSIPIHREGMDRPAMSASTPDTTVGTPLRAEEESARSRAMTSEQSPIVHDELYEEPRRVETRTDTEEGTRKLDLSGETEPKDKRGI
ncbi:hypothetical protein [Vitiosangium sp. GDMCC 1.1324]|uniref:hypothetical protein n=1 Tax=Vitiosangium sp. (strain GDMCC 1.1324) TaxID=2138576 RepID=UPI0011B67B15|nr:hypothetical protein [Vitiosangium sp. GDMCC 1.1324]